MSNVCIILVNYKNNKDTLKCLDSLSKLKSKHKVLPIIIHVQTKPNSNILQHQIRPRSINVNSNSGFAAANNIGIKEALKTKPQYIMLLNNDTTVKHDFLDPLIRRLKNEHIGIVSPKIYFSPGHEYHLNNYSKASQGSVIWYAGGVIDWKGMYASHWGVDELDLGQHNQASATDFATGCCCIVPTKILDKVGLLNETYFMYWEDTDWSHRISKSGYQIWYEPASIIWHKNAGSTEGSGSNLQKYYQTRNRLTFGLKHASPMTKASLLAEAIHIYKSDAISRKAVIDSLMLRKGRRDDI